MSYRPWSKEEDELVRTYYPVIGGRWSGWAKLMPERMPTHDDITHRARKLGVKCEHQFRYGKGKAEAKKKADVMMK